MKLLLVASLSLATTASYGSPSKSPPAPEPAPAKADKKPALPTSSMSSSERAELHAPDEGHNTGLPKYADAPADPWLAVDGDQPRRRPVDYWTVRDSELKCTAAHDHCLEADTWFLTQGDLADKSRLVSASVALFGPKGTLYPGNIRAMWVRDDYVAYHTVPATKANMVPGAIVFGLGRPKVIPNSGGDAAQVMWDVGVLESIDVDIGVYKLKNYHDTMMLPGARVAVLKWVPGGKVEIIGGKAKADLAVKVGDVFLPEN